uniref:Uncharacterized protein n=1 Tax=Compsopogon caeruleus TaxID=31354 RepID=A0A7S1TGF4_9RHOD
MRFLGRGWVRSAWETWVEWIERETQELVRRMERRNDMRVRGLWNTVKNGSDSTCGLWERRQHQAETALSRVRAKMDRLEAMGRNPGGPVERGPLGPVFWMVGTLQRWLNGLEQHVDTIIMKTSGRVALGAGRHPMARSPSSALETDSNDVSRDLGSLSIGSDEFWSHLEDMRSVNTVRPLCGD